MLSPYTPPRRRSAAASVAFVVGLSACNTGSTGAPSSVEPSPAAAPPQPPPLADDGARSNDEVGASSLAIPGDLPAPALTDLLAGSCRIDGEAGVVSATGPLPELGTELWLVTRAGVFAGEVTGVGGCDAEQLADPEEAELCPEPWAIVEAEGALSCGESYAWTPEPGVVADFPAAHFFIAVPRAFAPPKAPPQSVEVHLFDARCEVQGEDEGEHGEILVSDSTWPLRSSLDALLPSLVGAPRRVTTLMARGENPLHLIAATILRDSAVHRTQWRLVGGAPGELRRLFGRHELVPGSKAERSPFIHLLEHSCQTPYLMAPTPSLLFRLDRSGSPLLLTADERGQESVRMELWDLDRSSQEVVLRFPSPIFSPKF